MRLERGPPAGLVDHTRAVEDVEVARSRVDEQALVAVAVVVRLVREGGGVTARRAEGRGQRVVANRPRLALVGGHRVVDRVEVGAVAERVAGELVVDESVPVAAVGVDPDTGEVAEVLLGVAVSRDVGRGEPRRAVVAPPRRVVVAVEAVRRVDGIADRGGSGRRLEVGAGVEVPLAHFVGAVQRGRLLVVVRAVLVDVGEGGRVGRRRSGCGRTDRHGEGGAADDRRLSAGGGERPDDDRGQARRRHHEGDPARGVKHRFSSFAR